MDNKKKIKNRLKRIRGQVDGILNMIEEDKYCLDVSTQLMAVISALNSANREILSTHIKSCVSDSLKSKDEKDIDIKIQEIEKIIMKLGK